MADKNNANLGFEKQIWDAACVLWGHIPAAEYRQVIVGLIFLRYISSAFDKKYTELVEEGDGFEDDRDAYEADGIFFVPPEARWETIASAAHKPEIGTVIDTAMRAIEAENKSLKNVLPKNFGNPDLDKKVLGDVVDIFTNSIHMDDIDESSDLLGRTYEYCIAQFAASGAVNFFVAPDKEEEKNNYLKEALAMHQALSLCSSVVDESLRIEAAFMEAVRVLLMKLMNQGGGGKKISLPEMNARINELLKQSIKSDGVINLFSDVKEEFSLFDPKFLADVAKMKEKNLAVELLKKLIAEQIVVFKRTNVVKSGRFSEIIQETMNRYLNGMLTNEEVIQELLKIAKDIANAKEAGTELGLSDEEMAFYDALTKPEAIKDFYENDQLVALTKELTETLRKNQTIDWQKKDQARARMRMMIKKLLKKYDYPPEGREDAVLIVMQQCELWTDKVMMA